MDITSLLSSSNAFTTLTGTQYTSLTVAEEGKIPVKQLVTKMVSGISSNDLTSLKNISRATSAPSGTTPLPLSIPIMCRLKFTGRTRTAASVK